MDIATKKAELIEWLSQLQDQSLLDKVDDLKKKANKVSDAVAQKSISDNQYKAILDQAEEDFKKGKVTSQEDIEKESLNW